MTWISTSLQYLRPPAPGEPAAWKQTTAGRPGQRLIEAGPVPAPDAVREALTLGVGDSVVRRVSLILLDGEPIEEMTSYWPALWADGTALAQPAPVKGGTIALLRAIGRFVARSVEDVGAEVAGPDNVPAAPAGAPLLVIGRLLLDAGGEPVEYTVMKSWDGHRQRYVLEVD